MYRMNADCPTCPFGVDLEVARTYIPIFAKMLVANCDQVGQIVYNATMHTPGSVASYEDLWKFTLANYHSGSGCLSFALFHSWDRASSIAWWDITPRIPAVCSSAVTYVNNITH